VKAAEITDDDREALRQAVRSLEHPSLASRLTNLVAKPVELIGAALPAAASKAIASATSKGLEAALKLALRTLPASPSSGSELLHRALATASGAAGGTFGLAALPVELPVSTVIMLRSIADIARSEGEDPQDPAAALACVEVFALGGRAGSTDASESGYFATRTLLAKTVSEAARFIAERGVVGEGAPVLLKFVTQVAARFGVVVSQKVAAQALPIVGALGGAAVNYAFWNISRRSGVDTSRCGGLSAFMARKRCAPNTISSPLEKDWHLSTTCQLAALIPKTFGRSRRDQVTKESC
jgi:hypothetical protein